MPVTSTVFTHVEFWLSIVFSFMLPVAIYWRLLTKRAIARHTVLLLGVTLVAIAGVDVYLLRSLNALALASASLSDDKIFNSEVSVALYLLPAMFGGIGINIISDILIKHLHEAEAKYRNQHPEEKQ